MAKTKNTNDGDDAGQTPSGDRVAATTDGPEESAQKGAATLEEAMAQSDALARGASAEAAAESGEAKAAADAEATAAIEEAGKAQEARDDAVYGREPGGEDRRIGYADAPEVTAEDVDAAEAALREAQTKVE